MSKDEITEYLRTIGAKGGKARSKKKAAAARENARKPRPKARIIDEFSHIEDRRERYRLRKAKAK